MQSVAWFYTVLVSILAFLVIETTIHYIDEYLGVNKRIVYVLASIVVGSIIVFMSFLLGNVLLNETSEGSGATVWEVQFFRGTSNPLYTTSRPIWTGRIEGNQNGLEYSLGHNSPRTIISLLGNQDYPLGVFGIPKNDFSAKYETVQYFSSGNYCFEVTMIDDGALLLIDSVPVIQKWWGYQPGGIYRESVYLNDGYHIITFYHLELIGTARFSTSWYSGPGPECTTTGDPAYQSFRSP